jgi:hypothetical protein
VNLNAFAADKRLRILEDLKAGHPPHEGAFDEAVLREAKAKGQPQMGATRYEPYAIHLEFVYPNPQGASIIVTVTLTPPERIVFMPVPAWVVESIWQGEIDGTFHFETEAFRLAEQFVASLSPVANPAHFAPRQQTGKA